MSDPTFWDNPDKAREISQEAIQLKNAVESYKQLVSDIEDANMMLEMAIDEDDLSMESEIKEYVKQIEETLEKQEVLLLLSGEYDANNAFNISCWCWWDGGTRLVFYVNSHVLALG